MWRRVIMYNNTGARNIPFQASVCRVGFELSEFSCVRRSEEWRPLQHPRDLAQERVANAHLQPRGGGGPAPRLARRIGSTLKGKGAPLWSSSTVWRFEGSTNRDGAQGAGGDFSPETQSYTTAVANMPLAGRTPVAIGAVPGRTLPAFPRSVVRPTCGQTLRSLSMKTVVGKLRISYARTMVPSASEPIAKLTPTSLMKSCPSCTESRPSSCTPTNSTPSFRWFWKTFSRSGISARHGGHEGNQKLTTTGRPLRPDRP